MPELPEVETVRRSLEPWACGRRIRAISRSDKPLRFPPGEMDRAIGCQVLRLLRRAKTIFVELDSGDRLVLHLGMTGAWERLDKMDPPRPHEHLRFVLDDGGALAYTDPRRFGGVSLVDSSEAARLAAAYGPEPIDPGFGAASLLAVAKGDRPLKSLLLDQSAIAGIGNIYACEALFRARLHPASPAGRLKLKSAELLAAELRAVLLEAIEAGGSTIADFRAPDGSAGKFTQSLLVYGREGEACFECAQPIRRIVQSGRSSFFCSRCQKKSR
jgi:formamidopyrimidine-DNA glycosylase